MNYGLPWTNSGRTVHGNTIFQDVATAQNIELAAYIVRACNNHERLVAALREVVREYGGSDLKNLDLRYSDISSHKILINAAALLTELETNT